MRRIAIIFREKNSGTQPGLRLLDIQIKNILNSAVSGNGELALLRNTVSILPHAGFPSAPKDGAFPLLVSWNVFCWIYF
jgi:hypothetical protein